LAILFGAGAVIHLTYLRLIPPGWKAMVIIAILLGVPTAFFNLFAAIKGVVTLSNSAVRKRFRANRE
jgi:hypothetical protein